MSETLLRPCRIEATWVILAVVGPPGSYLVVPGNFQGGIYQCLGEHVGSNHLVCSLASVLSPALLLAVLTLPKTHNLFEELIVGHMVCLGVSLSVFGSPLCQAGTIKARDSFTIFTFITHTQELSWQDNDMNGLEASCFEKDTGDSPFLDVNRKGFIKYCYQLSEK